MLIRNMEHQYIERETKEIMAETFFADRAIRLLYSRILESSPRLFSIVTGSRISQSLAYLNYDSFIGKKIIGLGSFLRKYDIRTEECLENPRELTSLRRIFERKIRFWDCRPMPQDSGSVVSPCDAKMIYGSLNEASQFFIKGKFFDFEELLGKGREEWLSVFAAGDFAVFRLTPEKYHYNHAPVFGIVKDFYTIEGTYHSCHPEAIVTVCTPYSKNKRVVTIINTDIPGGTRVGLVAMVEVAALMIGDILQCYCHHHYDHPVPVGKGLFLRKGQPKSLFRPGSSTVLLFFEKDRLRFSADIAANMFSHKAKNIFCQKFDQRLIETDVKVRSLVGTRRGKTGERKNS